MGEDTQSFVEGELASSSSSQDYSRLAASALWPDDAVMPMPDRSRRIVYPTPLTTGKGIGVTAPSSGVSSRCEPRLDRVISQLRRRGYLVKEGRCLRGDHKHVSAPADSRASDLVSLWNDPDVSAIIPPWGGELLIDLLPLLDFEALASGPSPKWLLGDSDTSTLLFAFTLRTGIATAHGTNLMELMEEQVYGVTQTTLGALALEEGAVFLQESYPKYQVRPPVRWEDDPAALFDLQEETRWRPLGGGAVEMRGRLIGGCLDTLMHLVGTPFGDLGAFKRSFREDGVILYLENCGQPPCSVARALWSMRLAGWFEGLGGIVFGRSAAIDASSDDALSYRDALEGVLGPVGVPVILDADIGHRPPQHTLINGALAEVKCRDGRGSVRQALV